MKNGKLFGAILLVGTTLVSEARAQYLPYPYGQGPVTASSRGYDPYASGFGPCPEGGGDEGYGKCSNWIEPTYGQPSFSEATPPPN